MLKRLLLVLMFLSSTTFAGSTQSLDKIVAVVNDNVITDSELNAKVELLKKELIAKGMEMPPVAALRKQVLEHLINEDLQIQLAKQNNLTIDDNELNEALERIASSNKLNMTQLREAVIQQGLQWDFYRENIRKEVLISRLQQKSVARNIAMVTDQQVQDFIKINGELDQSQRTFHVQNIVIPLAEEPTTAQIKKANEKAMEILAKIQKGADFTKLPLTASNSEFSLNGSDLGERHLAELPEIFAKEVVRMKPGAVAGPLRTGNGFQIIKLIAIGGTNPQHIVHKTHVRHILLKNDTSTTAAEAERQANNIYQQLQSGKDFAKMAKKHSLDTATAVKGGDLGWITPGELVPPFEQAMDSLALNQISRPVKTNFGWHIIQVLERKNEDDTEAFQKQQVRSFLQQRKFAEAVQSWQQTMRGTAYVKVLDKELA